MPDRFLSLPEADQELQRTSASVRETFKASFAVAVSSYLEFKLSLAEEPVADDHPDFGVVQRLAELVGNPEVHGARP